MQLHKAQVQVRHFALSLSLVERQFVVTHIIRQAEIPALLDSSMTNTPSLKFLFESKTCLFTYLRKITRCVSVGLLNDLSV
jgi:hypothetical protein